MGNTCTHVDLETKPKALTRQDNIHLLWKEYLSRPVGYVASLCNTCGGGYDCECHFAYFKSQLTDIEIQEFINRKPNWKQIQTADIEKMWEQKVKQEQVEQLTSPSFMCKSCKTTCFLSCACAKKSFVRGLTHLELMRYLRNGNIND